MSTVHEAALDVSPIGDFRLGEVVIKSDALEFLGADEARHLVNRHAQRDWGEENQAWQSDVNDHALDLGFGQRIISNYLVRGTQVLVATSADRMRTIVALMTTKWEEV